MGNGYRSIANQLFYRWENVVRRKRKLGVQTSTSRKLPYGCKNWNPKCTDNPSTEARITWLTKEYQKIPQQWDMEHVLLLMQNLFPQQRELINKAVPVETVLQEWPFLARPTIGVH